MGLLSTTAKRTHFPTGRGWNGCLSLPRILSLTPEGNLVQKPAAQLTQLRGGSKRWKNVRLQNRGEILTLPQTNTFELLAEIDLKSAKSAGLRFHSPSRNSPPITISFNGAELNAADVKTPLHFAKEKKRVSLRIFLDRSVLEVFANEEACVTRVIPVLDVNSSLEIFARDGEAHFKRIEVWPIKTIW